jgi:hypothetical protein
VPGLPGAPGPAGPVGAVVIVDSVLLEEYKKPPVVVPVEEPIADPVEEAPK